MAKFKNRDNALECKRSSLCSISCKIILSAKLVLKE